MDEGTEKVLRRFEENHLRHIQEGINRIDRKLDAHLTNYDRFKDEVAEKHSANAQNIAALQASGSSNMGWIKSLLLLVLGPIVGAAITFFTIATR